MNFATTILSVPFNVKEFKIYANLGEFEYPWF